MALNPDVTKFQSPVPFLIKFRNFVFGKEKPDIYTRVVFIVNLIIWLSFQLWTAISYFTLYNRSMIEQQKGIQIEKIIRDRGVELGFIDDDFISRLLTLNAIGIICWGLVFFGLILLFRKRKQFIFFMLGGSLFYLGMSVFYVSYSYFIEDTTTFDKIALLILITSSSFHYFLLNNERNGGEVSLFGEAEED